MINKNYYFTFGQDHIHRVNQQIFDCDTVLEIRSVTYEMARKIMEHNFGQKWAFQYTEKPDMSYFPRGIKRLGGP